MKIKIGGVPEHFNLPWHLAIEENAFENEGIEVEWWDFPGGTGAMTKALRDDSVDIAIVLTEGIIADIIKGNPSKIVGQYIKSPLVWGIHTAAHAPFQSADELKGAKFSISRFGSGSHIMAFVDANNRGWDPQKQEFVKVGNFDGARTALKDRTADVLLWEKFTTKPYVDSGELRRIGETITPWPCFVIAVTNNALENKLDAVQKVLKVIHRQADTFKNRPDAETASVEMVAKRYEQKIEDVKEWFSITEWANNNLISRAVLRNVVDTLFDVGVIDKKVEPEELCSNKIINFEKRQFNFADKEEQTNFFNKDVPDLLQKIEANDKPLWGIMTAQHMVEHLGGVLLLGLKKVNIPAMIPPEKQVKVKKGLLSNKPMRRSVPIPGMEGKLLPLQFENIDVAKEKLLKTLNKAITVFDNPDGWNAPHPYAGDCNGQEWKIFQYKHFIHHFKQFGLID